MNGKPEQSLYERVGGMPFFESLVAAFYRGVEQDPILRPMYEEEDLGPSAERLTLFLAQYWGGPRTYSETRGHPRLRARHNPFVIDATARDAWLANMLTALETQEVGDEERAELRQYMLSAAEFLVNAGSAGHPAM
jgi:hemoglobin